MEQSVMLCLHQLRHMSPGIVCVCGTGGRVCFFNQLRGTVSRELALQEK
jgi:hypothetical protein